MKATTQGSSEIKIKETHSVSSGKGISRPQGAPNTHRRHRNPNNSKIKQNRRRENSSSSTVDVLDVEAITKGKHHAQL